MELQPYAPVWRERVSSNGLKAVHDFLCVDQGKASPQVAKGLDKAGQSFFMRASLENVADKETFQVCNGM